MKRILPLFALVLVASPAGAQPEVIERAVDWTPRPTTGYVHVPEAGALPPIRLRILPGAGWNQSTTGNDGRTGIPAVYIEIQHDGQGDGGGVTVVCRGSGQPRGAPLANPACFLLNGQVDAQADGQYLQGTEIVLRDYGHRNVSGSGHVLRHHYAGPVDDPTVYRFGYRSQTEHGMILAHFTAWGGARTGIDLSGLDSDDRASVVMRRGDCLYYSARPSEQPQRLSDLGRDATCIYDYEDHPDLYSVLTIVDGNPSLQVQRWGVAVEGGFAATGELYLPGVPVGGEGRPLCRDRTGRIYEASGPRC